MSSMQQEDKEFGVLAMDMYIPTRFVSQSDMEEKDGCSGKYTVGLGQQNMAFCDDREDITSMFLTVVSSLMKKYDIKPEEIGRLEVGTETLLDKSKSIKTSIMRLFGDNTDMEGVTNVNACYGGTAALFNSMNWLESKEWDGRYALVVCGDIAVYEEGPARPTGGAGTLAILLGPNAPLVMESGVRSTHCLDVYDFYKPHHSEYAVVDGKLSQWAYLSSVDTCYQRYKQKYAKKMKLAGGADIDINININMDHFDFFAFHSPYNKLVQKGFGRMRFIDAVDNTTAPEDALKDFIGLPLRETYESRDLEVACRTLAKSRFDDRVMPCCKINQNIGNCYTGSVYSSLLSVIMEKTSADLLEKRIAMFSYGSGSVASLFSFVGKDTTGMNGGRFSLARMKELSAMKETLSNRTQCSVEEFSAALALRAAKYGAAPMSPDGNVDHIRSGTYYLKSVNDKHHREYEIKA